MIGEVAPPLTYVCVSKRTVVGGPTVGDSDAFVVAKVSNNIKLESKAFTVSLVPSLLCWGLDGLLTTLSYNMSVAR